MSHVTIQELANLLEEIAPLSLAEKWDNVGLIWGDWSRTVERVMTCLTLTEDVLEEAIEGRAELIVTHHPILFKPTQRLDSRSPDGRLLLKLGAAGIAVYSPHTAFDNANEGINQFLAERLGLQEIEPLRLVPAEELVKIIVFVPEEHRRTVLDAAWGVGAGGIGRYSKCSFYSPGTGTFQGDEGTNPAVGEPGRYEEVAESAVQVIAPRRLMQTTLKAIRAAHPYEEPAIDVYGLVDGVMTHGAGRFGRLPEPMTLAAFHWRVRERLPGSHGLSVGDPDRSIKRVAIACGAAGEFLPDAKRSGCDVFVTGEARFHTCLEARRDGMSLILPGHYATERIGVEYLAHLIRQRQPAVEVWASTVERDPVVRA